jgi:hypothetical protein
MLKASPSRKKTGCLIIAIKSINVINKGSYAVALVKTYRQNILPSWTKKIN